MPAHGSKGEKALERQALTILVGRARLEQKAADLGVQVSNEEVLKLVGAGSTAASEQEGNANFVASQARAQLLYEKLFARVTGGIKVTDAEAGGTTSSIERCTAHRRSARSAKESAANCSARGGTPR